MFNKYHYFYGRFKDCKQVTSWETTPGEKTVTLSVFFQLFSNIKTLMTEIVFYPSLKSTAFLYKSVLKIAKSDYELRLVCNVLSVLRADQFSSHWKDFHWILYFSIFRKYVKKSLDLLKSGNNNWYFIWQTIRMYNLPSPILVTMENISHKLCRGSQKIHIFSIFLFRKSYRLIVNVARHCRVI